MWRRGFRGWTPPYPYIGIGRGGLPRCAWPGWWYGYIPPYVPDITPEEEIEYLKEEAEFLRKQLAEIEKRIRDLESQR
ncbi:MAG TPA: DUF5320 family protein [bacterium]|nr:DUF5320 family protein [bacterium]HOL34520.1 DUF5320 family protein [bacterium]HPP08068.1 DUF5320 family protein [bacterium]